MKKTYDYTFDIPQWHKNIVRERIENSSDDDYISWKETKKLLKK